MSQFPPLHDKRSNLREGTLGEGEGYTHDKSCHWRRRPLTSHESQQCRDGAILCQVLRASQAAFHKDDITHYSTVVITLVLVRVRQNRFIGITPALPGSQMLHIRGVSPHSRYRDRGDFESPRETRGHRRITHRVLGG